MGGEPAKTSDDGNRWLSRPIGFARLVGRWVFIGPDWRRTVTVLLAAVYLLGTLIAGLAAWFNYSFPFENQPPEHGRSLLWPAGVACVFAVLTFAAIAVNRWRLAAGAFVVHGIVAGILLAGALGLSDHSDEALVVCASVIELAGLGAVVLGRRV